MATQMIEVHVVCDVNAAKVAGQVFSNHEVLVPYRAAVNESSVGEILSVIPVVEHEQQAFVNDAIEQGEHPGSPRRHL